MSNNRFIPGNEVVVIEPHPDYFAKGDIFIIRSSIESSCQCMPSLVDIGFNTKHHFIACRKCGEVTCHADGIRWFDSNRSALIDSKEAEEMLKDAQMKKSNAHMNNPNNNIKR